jgi:hypothetical protein
MSHMPNDPDHLARAIAGLGREVEQQGRRLADLGGLEDQVHDLAAVVTSLAERAISSQARPTAPVSWIAFEEEVFDPAAPMAARSHLAGLADWLDGVFLRYPDGSPSLPDCWLWHPDVVEELTWLREAWVQAYRGPSASAGAAGDWHDRQRPGVARRIKVVAGTCSLENHELGPARDRSQRRAPLTGCVGRIADWWTRSRRDLPPAPSGDAAANRK